MANGIADVGEMRQRVTWRTYDPTVLDRMNQPTRTPTVMGTFWAKVEPLSGMELFNAGQIKGITRFKVTMRNVGPIKPPDDFLFMASRVLSVESVMRLDEQNGILILTCTEKH